MKKCLLFLVMVLLLTGCGKNDNDLVMVTEAGFPPYEFYENGKVVGVDIEIANEIAKELNKNLVIKDIAFDSIINELKSGKADFAAAGMSITEDRLKEADFTIEYIVSEQVVVVRNDSQINNIDDIK